jgi:hypothetical protein
MWFLGIGIGHCSQHPTETDIGASDGNDSDSQICMMENGEENDGNATEENNDTQDDEDEGTDLEEYGDSDDDL